MNPGCHVCLKELLDEGTRLVDTIIPDGLIIVLQRCYHIYYVLWHIQLREPYDVSQRLVALDGHDARQDGTLNANGPTVLHKLDEGLCLEEQLSDDEISTSINLEKSDYAC